MKNVIVSAGIMVLLAGTACNSPNHSDHSATTDTISNMLLRTGDTAMVPPADTMVPRSNINTDTPVTAQ